MKTRKDGDVIVEPIVEFKDGWKDCETYWLSTMEQRSEEWHNIRKNRLTASNFGAAIGVSSFSSPEDVALEILGYKHKTISNRSRALMDYGTMMESYVRDWYATIHGVEVLEVGIAIPKWEPRIGGSTDGLIAGTNGCIEIKCPASMYHPLKKHLSRINDGWIPPPLYHEHIWDSHYAQMQGCMRILNKEWCDYIVYADETIYVERVYFNQEYWDNVLWPGILRFLNQHLDK